MTAQVASPSGRAWRAAAAASVAAAVLSAPARARAEASGGERGRYVHLFGTAAVGRGLRLNNPYRLETVLGRDAESLSLSAWYADVGLGATLGDPEGWQHGVVVRESHALDGVPQDVVTPGYTLLRRFRPRYQAFARAGVPVVVRPDLSWGLEAAIGGVWLVTAALGCTAEVVGSVFYGAATWDRAATAIPIVSLQLGAWLDAELLP